MFSDKIVEKFKTHILGSLTSTCPEHFAQHSYD